MHSSFPNNIQTQEELLYWDNWRLVGSVRPDPALGMTSPIVYPVLSDHLGAPRKVLDPTTGYTRWDWDAKEPFGMQAPNENPSSAGGFVFNARFPGQWFDNETGFYHNGFRYYDPSLGRYTQSDPLGLEAGWNTYTYVESNPLGGVDYLGLLTENPIMTNTTVTSTWELNGTEYHAKFHVGHLYTSKGNPVEIWKWLEGDSNLQQNCVGYAFQRPYWIQPSQGEIILRDEYKKTTYEKSQFTVFYGGSFFKEFTFTHIGINLPNNEHIGKNGGSPIIQEKQKTIEKRYIWTTYYEKK